MIDLPFAARSLFVDGKGILAADESTKTADNRLKEHNDPAGLYGRQAFRELFLEAPGIEEFLSGVILYEETLRESDRKGVSFAKLLKKKGIIAGIKVDQGTEPIPESPKEVITGGLIGLTKRLHEYRDVYGAEFTKWRAVIRIDGDKLPTSGAIVENVKRLAMSSRCVQEAGMVPILEPEVLHDGKHSRLRAKEVLIETLSALMKALDEHSVDRTGLIIKTAMALSGSESKKKDAPEEVAIDTVDALMSAVPRDVAGIVFLSGGQSPDEATENLRAIMQEAKKRKAPWPLTFSFARALQDEALDIWQGKNENVPAAREAFLVRLKKVSAALMVS